MPSSRAQVIDRRALLAAGAALLLPGPALAARRARPSAEEVAAYVHPAGGLRADRAALRGPNGALVALTFDDGPDPVFTPAIARTLSEHQASATFFLIGRRVLEEPAVVRQLVAAGHEIAAHSHTHPQMSKLADDAIRHEMTRSLTALARAVPEADVRWFRPPYGDADQRVIAAAGERGMDTLRWDVDPEDWRQERTVEDIENAVLGHLRPGAVVLMHSINARSAAALPGILRRGREMGYEFVTASRWWQAASGRSRAL